MKVKRMIALLAAAACLIGCFGCAGTEDPAETETPTTTGPSVSQAAMEKLDGKKVLVVGNSYSYHGYAVMREKGLTQEQRSNDRGYFYQICKSQGAEVSVTNWTFGDHSLWETLGNSCTRDACYGVDHLSYLTDRYFDYVVLQPYERSYDGDLMEYLEPFMAIFTEVNPDVQFILPVPHMIYHQGYAWLRSLTAVDRDRIIVCNWGKMLADILDGTVQVPNAKQQYIFASFVVSRSEKDGYHQNQLAGYITAAMLYCVITGDSAVGLPYDFCNDPTIDPLFSFDAYKKEYYCYDPFTNFVEIFESPEDMEGLQQLIDKYSAEPFGN